jgi:hypothetical protein
VDSSLLEEWERMRDPAWQPRAEPAATKPEAAMAAAADVTRDTRAFTAAIRNRIFTLLRALVIGDDDLAARIALGAEPERSVEEAEAMWTAARMKSIRSEYLAAHGRLCLDPEARNARHTYVTPSDDGRSWRVQQMLVDPDGLNDWVAEFDVDLAASRQANEPVMVLQRMGALA